MPNVLLQKLKNLEKIQVGNSELSCSFGSWCNDRIFIK